jgi:hypothetical protein
MLLKGTGLRKSVSKVFSIFLIVPLKVNFFKIHAYCINREFVNCSLYRLSRASRINTFYRFFNALSAAMSPTAQVPFY